MSYEQIWEALKLNGPDPYFMIHRDVVAMIMADLEIARAERDAVSATWDEIHAEFMYAKARAEAAEAELAKLQARRPGYQTPDCVFAHTPEGECTGCWR
jgi:hypothetical protein